MVRTVPELPKPPKNTVKCHYCKEFPKRKRSDGPIPYMIRHVNIVQKEKFKYFCNKEHRNAWMQKKGDKSGYKRLLKQKG